jgi:hypothetical protein
MWRRSCRRFGDEYAGSTMSSFNHRREGKGLAVRFTGKREPVSKIIAHALRDELCVRCRLTTSGLCDAIAVAPTTIRKVSPAPSIVAVFCMFRCAHPAIDAPAVRNIYAEASLPNQPCSARNSG